MGDGNPAAKLLAAVCDELIVHPNVVNASDLRLINIDVLITPAGCWGPPDKYGVFEHEK